MQLVQNDYQIQRVPLAICHIIHEPYVNISSLSK